MKLVLLLSIILCATVKAERLSTWTGEKCAMESKQLYDRTLGYDTCIDYCKHLVGDYYDSAHCEIDQFGYGKCRCYYNTPY